MPVLCLCAWVCKKYSRATITRNNMQFKVREIHVLTIILVCLFVGEKNVVLWKHEIRYIKANEHVDLSTNYRLFYLINSCILSFCRVKPRHKIFLLQITNEIQFHQLRYDGRIQVVFPRANHWSISIIAVFFLSVRKNTSFYGNTKCDILRMDEYVDLPRATNQSF